MCEEASHRFWGPEQTNNNETFTFSRFRKVMKSAGIEVSLLVQEIWMLCYRALNNVMVCGYDTFKLFKLIHVKHGT
jgi:hypothetical protein